MGGAVKVTDGDREIPPGEYTLSYGENTQVGTGTVTVADRDGGNYVIVQTVADFTITKADQTKLTITGAPGSVTYGDTFQLGVSGGSGTGSVSWAASGAIVDDAGNVTITGAGMVIITAMKEGDSNYFGTEARIMLDVSEKALTVSSVNAQGRAYDGTDKVAITAVTLDGIVGSDTVAVDVSGIQGTLSCANAGMYTAVTLPQLTLAGADSGNYTLVQPQTPVPTSVEVTPLDAVITVGTDTYHKTFGDVAFTLDVTDNNTEADTQYEAGYTGDVWCTDCGELLSEGSEIPLTNHQGGTATCIKPAVCAVCGQEYGTVDAGNHEGSTEVRESVAAGCTEGGYTGDVYCMDCGAKVETGTATSALGHDYKSEVTKEPTEDSEGIRTYTCIRCGDSYTESMDRLEPSKPGSTPEPSNTPEPEATAEPSSTPEPGATAEPSSTPEPGNTPEPGATAEPSSTPEPGATAEPSSTPEPGNTPEPGATAEPSSTPEPGATAEPSSTPEPEATAEPSNTPEPGATAEPSSTPEPGATAEPSSTPEPEATTEPSSTPEPGATSEPNPGTTPEPGNTPEPEVTPEPGATSEPPSPDITPEPGKPFIKGKDGKIGWDVIRAEEMTAEEGSVINVDMNGTAVVPGDIFDLIRGRDITVTFDMGGGILWSVDGKKIQISQAEDIDFSVRPGTDHIPMDIVNNITGERCSIQVSLSHDGEFGFTAVLSINLGKENAGYTASLYYYNQGIGEVEFISKSRIGEDGTASLTFSHASEYVIVIGEEQGEENGGTAEPERPEGAGSTDGADKTGDIPVSPITGQEEQGRRIIWAVLLTAAVSTGVFLAVRRKRGDENIKQ